MKRAFVMVVLLVSFCRGSRADFVYTGGQTSVLVPDTISEDQPQFQTPAGNVNSIPIAVNQNFFSLTTPRSTIQGNETAGTVAMPGDSYFALAFSNSLSVSGIPMSNNVQDATVSEGIWATGRAYVDPSPLLDAYFQGFISGSGYLAPGDTISWSLQVECFIDGPSWLEQDLSGTITTPGNYSILQSTPKVDVGPVDGVVLMFSFGLTVYKGGGGGTTTFTTDPGITVSSPEPAAAVPESSTLTLLGIGAVCSLGYGWRRRRQSA